MGATKHRRQNRGWSASTAAGIGRLARMGLGLIPLATRLAAAEVDLSKLPPPATVTIEFRRDIQPILDASCLRCHGPEKPKGKFRLDTRESALRGGDGGVDIVPGNSAGSPLIHFVARLVADSEMPPEGKGDPLTAQEVGLLRAWIDQGAAWDSEPPTNQWTVTLAPVVGGTFVSGNRAQFREHSWQPDGANGGLGEFDWLQKPDANTTWTASGHAWRDDYRVTMEWKRNEFGFIRSGWEQYRKYYNDTGGYRPTLSTPFAPSLNRDLHLDLGKAWIDFGLTLPDWPRIIFGYEYDYREGDKSLTSWGGTGTGFDLRNLVPTTKRIDESVHIIKFDLDHEIRGVAIEERFRGEFYDLNTARTNFAARGPTTENARERDRHFQGVNTLRFEKRFTDWWYGSGGYLYSKLNSEASFQDNVTYPLSGANFLSTVPQITLERESHVVNANGLLGPFAGLTLSTGLQSEWTRQHAFGSGILNQLAFTLTPPGTLALNPATLVSDYDQNSVSENVALRYTRVPFTVLFAEARFQQQWIGQSDADLQASGNFVEHPSFSSALNDVRAGFSTSPWRSLSFSAHYRRYDNESRYRNDPASQPTDGYPGFITSRGLTTDETEAKLVWHPRAAFKATLAYQYLTTDYRTETEAIPGGVTPGGGLLSGRYDSQVYSLGVTVAPRPRLNLTTTLTYQPTTLTTPAFTPLAVVPYRGDIYSVLVGATYVLNPRTDLFTTYSFSKANYGQGNRATGVPAGLEYDWHGVQAGITRRWNQNTSLRLQYNFNHYDEPSSGGANDYEAHGVFVTMSQRFP